MEGEFFSPLPSARHRGEPVEYILCVLKQIGIPIGIAVAVVSNSKNQVLFCFRHSERDVGFFFDFHIFFFFEQCKDTIYFDSIQIYYYFF